MDPLFLGGVSLLFIAIVTIVFEGAKFLRDRRLISRRMSSEGMAHAVDAGNLSVTFDEGVLARFDKLVTPGDDAERSKTHQRLVRAGYRRPAAMRVYFLYKAGCALLFGIVAAMAAPAFAGSIPLALVLPIIIAAAFFGNMLPNIWVERQIQRRQEAAELGFPDVLDMLLVCIEAGLGIDQALKRVSAQIGSKSPVLAQELKVINEELLAGKERAHVFSDFADRLGVSDIKAFTTVLNQSDEFGVSVAEALRVYASEMRHKRVMRAEEKANLMPVKVAMGSVFFTIPPIMLIMAGPSLIMLIRAFTTVSQH